MKNMNVWLRSKAQVILVVVCVVLMITFFVPFDRLFSASRMRGGKIFGKKIPGEEVEAIARLYYNPQRRDSSGLVMAQAWHTLILANEGSKLGLKVTAGEIAAYLRRLFPARDRTSASPSLFDEQAYREKLRSVQMTKREYEGALRTVILSDKAQAAARDSITASPEEAWLGYCRNEAQAEVRYIQLRAKALSQLVTVVDEEMRQFYDAHKDQLPKPVTHTFGYMEPEKVKIEYIIAHEADYLDKAEISTEQINDYYKAHLDDYLADNPEPASAIEDKNGDETTAKIDADTGDVETDENETTKNKSTYKPLEEVSKTIEGELRAEYARDRVAKDLKSAYDDIQVILNSKKTDEDVAIDLAKIAGKYNLKHEITDFFSESEHETILPGSTPGLLAMLFGKGTAFIDRIRPIVEMDSGEMIFRVMAVQEPQEKSFDEVKDDVERDFRLTKGFDLARTVAMEAEKAGSFDSAREFVTKQLEEKLKELTITDKTPADFFRVTLSPYFGRPRSQAASDAWEAQDYGLPEEFPYVNAASVAFRLRRGEVKAVLEGGEDLSCLLIERLKFKFPERADFEKNAKQIIAECVEEKAENRLVVWTNDVFRRSAPSPEVIEALKPFLSQDGT